MGNARTEKRKRQRARLKASQPAKAPLKKLERDEANWQQSCSNCGETPTVKGVGLCGPCCFGEADTAGGNW